MVYTHGDRPRWVLHEADDFTPELLGVRWRSGEVRVPRSSYDSRNHVTSRFLRQAFYDRYGAQAILNELITARDELWAGREPGWRVVAFEPPYKELLAASTASGKQRLVTVMVVRNVCILYIMSPSLRAGDIPEEVTGQQDFASLLPAGTYVVSQPTNACNVLSY